jgi:hypothetical protein
MRSRRFFFFILSILVGLGIGLLYGWVINPPPYANLAPETLRADYKADYVLMIAEIYKQDGNLPQALRRLSQLENLPPARVVAGALLTARDLNYDPADLAIMAKLSQDLQQQPEPQGTVSSPVPTGSSVPVLTPTPTGTQP